MGFIKRLKAYFGSDDEKSRNPVSEKEKRKMEGERETVKDFCDQLVEISFHVEEIKNEYKLVTSYLTDIQRIEELPVDMAVHINDVAARIERLDKSRETYLQSENLLSMEKYRMLDAGKEHVEDTIKQLNEMESRDAALRNDMGHLEGEKEGIRYMREEYADTIVRLRSIMITVLTLMLITCFGLVVYSMITHNPVTLYALAAGAIAMLCFTICYLRYNNLKAEIDEQDRKINRAISLLNKVKAKYINNTNTMDYIYGKYDVHSSQELSYQWEQYNTMVRDAKKYTYTNAEFKDACDELVGLMSQIGVEDPFVWPRQTNALIDRREMVEIKHSLNVRRQKLRENLESCVKLKENAITALRGTVEVNPGLEIYVEELLKPYNIKIDL